MKRNKVSKYVWSILLLVLIFYLTFHTIFSHHNINNIVRDIRNIDIKYILMGLFLMFLYFILQGTYMKRNLKLLDEDIKIHKGIFYSVIEFFFSGITPSSTGGQPVQLYYMNKDKIPKKKSVITLLLNTIYFKMIIVVFAILIFIFDSDLILSLSPLFVVFYILGILADSFMIIGGYLLLFHNRLLKKLLVLVEKFVRLFKKDFDLTIDESVEEYKNSVKLLKGHFWELSFELFITLLQRLCMFSISYVIYKAFGLSEYNYLQIIIIQISVQTAIEFVPLPGGAGVSEFLLNAFFITAFGEVLAPAAMIATRTFSFYIPLVGSGLIILCNYIKDNFIKGR